MLRSLEEASAWLEGLINVEREPDFRRARFSLDPVRHLLERLDHPERGLRVIHVAGSKGKGSTALFAEAVLRAAGARTGVFTSPHLESFAERFRIDGEPVAGDALAAAVESLRPHVEALRAEGPAVAPSFFDALTAAALLLFRNARVDCAVLEVGLGGRLDSTNVVTPAVACVTSVELEHTEVLGDTLAAIASEKAGIVKAGAPVVVGPLPDEAIAAVLVQAEQVGAPVARLGREFEVEIAGRTQDGLDVRLRDGPVEVAVFLPVRGDHQAANAALALACVRRCGAVAEGDLAEATERGLAEVELPGRIEILERTPWVIVDAAHTEASTRSLAQVLSTISRRRSHLVLSVSKGKALDAILANLLPQATRVTVTRAEPRRSLSPDVVAAAVRAAAPDVDVRVVPNPHLAVRAAREDVGAGDLLCAAGSVYLAGIARRVLREASNRAPVSVTRRVSPRSAS